jgi:uncharacterized phage-associated protein
VALLKNILDESIVKVKTDKKKLKKANTLETNAGIKSTTNAQSITQQEQPWYAPNAAQIKD